MAMNVGGSMPGLPFAGIPREMQARVDEVLREEPVWPAPTVTFSHRADGSGVSLPTLLRPHRRLVAPRSCSW